MKILVTGGAGFIGTNFIYYWLKNHLEDQIVNLDKLTYAGNLENLKGVENQGNYRFVKGDITDKVLVNKLMSEVDKVVHFAAETHVDRSIMNPEVFLNTNVFGTQILLEAAVKNQIKHFHHISTDEVFGSLDLDTDSLFNENSPFRPNSPYSASKASSDCFVRAYHKTFGLPVTITNCSNNFGPYMFPEKLIPLAITNLIEGEKVPVYGNGNQVRDWLYVEDHCRAIDLVLQKGEVGETYCIGGQGSKEREISNLELVKKIIKIMGKSESEIEFVKDRPGHDVRYAIDYNKAKQKLGYEPLYDFDTCLEKTISWYQTNQTWWQNIKSGEYQTYYSQNYGER